jgi:carbamoyltransferase
LGLVLGISAYYHDSAAALLCDGKIVAACQEERLTRTKHDSSFPSKAIAFCLNEQGISINDLDEVVFYDKPILKFERLIETYVQYAPTGFSSFVMAMPIWIKEKIFLRSTITKELKKLGLNGDRLSNFKLLFSEHHRSHAGAAFFPSPFKTSAVLCMDGVGEWATTSGWIGDGSTLRKLWDINFPHSLGLLYSAFTYYCGFKVNSGEYKLMGLAPYGEPKYVQKILENLIDVRSDGSFALNMEYFAFPTHLRMTNNNKFNLLFGTPARAPESELLQFHMDLAASVQAVTEDIVIKLATSLQKESGSENLCLAGGVALNCVANGVLLRKKIFKNIWIQPAAGDAGSALGAAYCTWYEYLGKSRIVGKSDSMRGSYLGPEISESESISILTKLGANFRRVEEDELFRKTVQAIAAGNVVGWCQGRMEFGPRALGARSIIADPRKVDMQTKLNLKIKFRESFRPFAPAILAERVGEVFEFSADSPYMLLVAQIKDEFKCATPSNYAQLFGIEKLKIPRSKYPSITHVDYSARLQTVHQDTNPRFHRLLSEFEELTGCPLLINTSFNVRGEPIVNSTLDAYRCFMRTEMDFLVIGNVIIEKKDQPAWPEDDDWRTEFALD